MGLDLNPMDRPNQGFEQRFKTLLEFRLTGEIPKRSWKDKIFGTSHGKETLEEEYRNISKSFFEILRAPLVGRDEEANNYIISKYFDPKVHGAKNDFIALHAGSYVAELAKEKDGIPLIVSETCEVGYRGKALEFCTDILSEEIIGEAWENKFADQSLDYSHRLFQSVETFIRDENLEHLKGVTDFLPDSDTDMTAIENQTVVVYSLVKWLRFYARNGCGFIANS